MDTKMDVDLFDQMRALVATALSEVATTEDRERKAAILAALESSCLCCLSLVRMHLGVTNEQYIEHISEHLRLSLDRSIDLFRLALFKSN